MANEQVSGEKGRVPEDEQTKNTWRSGEEDSAGFFWYLASIAAYIGRRSPAVSEIVVTKDLDVSSTNLF